MKFSKTQNEIISFLADHAGRVFYESQITKATALSAGAVNQALKDLAKKKWVNLEKKGNMNFFSLNLDSPPIRQFKVTQTVTKLNNLVEKLKPLSKRVILFGSASEGLNTEESDIDVLVVSNAKDKVRSMVREYRIDGEIQLLVYNSLEFVKLRTSDKVLYERVGKGITLWGAE